LVGRPEVKRSLRRSTRKWEDSIKIDLSEVVESGMDWIDLAKERGQWRTLVNILMNFRVPYNFGNS
jgi:hypothetical protein